MFFLVLWVPLAQVKAVDGLTGVFVAQQKGIYRCVG
jgi:hypothetical protein